MSGRLIFRDRRPLRCRWFGCEEHPEDPSPPDALACRHCEGSVEYADLVGDTPHRATMDSLYRVVRFVWPYRCGDCGRRWRACDDQVDHLPF